MKRLRLKQDVTAGGRWKVGDPIDSPTIAGREPSWSTVRSRYWKNRAASAQPGEFSDQALASMKKLGRAPPDPATGRPLELEHVTPQRTGDPSRHSSSNLIEVTDLEHAFFDRYRQGVKDISGRSWQYSKLDPRK